MLRPDCLCVRGLKDVEGQLREHDDVSRAWNGLKPGVRYELEECLICSLALKL